MSKKFWHTPAPVRNKQRELKANAYREGYNDGYKAGLKSRNKPDKMDLEDDTNEKSIHSRW